MTKRYLSYSSSFLTVRHAATLHDSQCLLTDYTRSSITVTINFKLNLSANEAQQRHIVLDFLLQLPT